MCCAKHRVPYMSGQGRAEEDEDDEEKGRGGDEGQEEGEERRLFGGVSGCGGKGVGRGETYDEVVP